MTERIHVGLEAFVNNLGRGREFWVLPGFEPSCNQPPGNAGDAGHSEAVRSS